MVLSRNTAGLVALFYARPAMWVSCLPDLVLIPGCSYAGLLENTDGDMIESKQAPGVTSAQACPRGHCLFWVASSHAIAYRAWPMPDARKVNLQPLQIVPVEPLKTTPADSTNPLDRDA